MPTCGHCGKTVAASDVTCPHCSVLLAAYASPTGSGADSTYKEPPAPPSADIPSVSMDVKPPSETDIVTDPTEVVAEAVSTAPRPLFDTYLTVEEIAKAAEGDHETDVVTIKDTKIATKPVAFDVPDYARPPSNAAPIPTVDEHDASIPLITRDAAQPRPSRTQADDAAEPEPEPDLPAESWLYGSGNVPVAPKPKPSSRKPAQSKPQPIDPVGETDGYLRRLHNEAGYTPAQTAVSKPVEERRITPAERGRNRHQPTANESQERMSASRRSESIGGKTLYTLILAILWLSTIVMILSGNFNTLLIFLTIAATWGFGPVRKFVNDMRDS